MTLQGAKSSKELELKRINVQDKLDSDVIKLSNVKSTIELQTTIDIKTSKDVTISHRYPDAHLRNDEYSDSELMMDSKAYSTVNLVSRIAGTATWKPVRKAVKDKSKILPE